MPPSSHELYQFGTPTQFLEVGSTQFRPMEIVEDEKAIGDFSGARCDPPDLLVNRKPEVLFYFPKVGLGKGVYKSHWSVANELCEYAIYHHNQENTLSSRKQKGEGARADLSTHYQTNLVFDPDGRITAIKIDVAENKSVKLLSAGTNGDCRQFVSMNGALHALLALSSVAQQQVFDLVDKQNDVYLAYGTPGKMKYGLFFNLQISKTEDSGVYLLKPLIRDDPISSLIPYFAVFSGIKSTFGEFATARVDFANLVE